MLYRVGTKKEIPMLVGRIPDRVLGEICRGTVVLSAEYGESRNYLESGGYSLIAETGEDILAVGEIISPDYSFEWATRIGKTEWASVLYVLNDDFSVVLYAPVAILPTKILDELED